MISQKEVKELLREDFGELFENKLRIFKSIPMLHQYAAGFWSWGRDRVMFLLGIGTGKTFASLISAHLWNCKKVLVICPSSVRKTWREEIQKHTSFSFVDLDGSSVKRKELLENTNAKFYIINYEGLKCVFGGKQTISRGKNSGKSRYIPNSFAMQKAGFDCVIVDECHNCRDFNAIQTRIAYELSKLANKCVLLTGTPIGSSMEDFWAEFMVLDQGETFGTSLHAFRSKYFNQYAIPITRGGRRFEITKWALKKGSKELLLKEMSNSVLRYDSAECCDLPPIVFETRHVNMSAEQEEYYDKILQGLRVDFEQGLITLSNVENATIKLAQILSGFIKKDNDVVYFKKNPKLEELIDVVSQLDQKVIVYHHFEAEGKMIEAALRKKRIRFASLRGEVKDKNKEIDKFLQDPEVAVLVAHPVTGGVGLNLQDSCNYAIFFSHFGSNAIIRPQAEGRIHRHGQTNTCVIVDLLIQHSDDRESLDERLYSASKGNKTFAKTILDWLAKK